MAPIGTVIVVALLALSGVDAKRKDEVSYSNYVSKDCNNHPMDGEIYDLRLKYQESKCEGISAGGVRFHRHRKDKYSKWINDVNVGRDLCFAAFYQGYGCFPDKMVAKVSLPKDFGKCNPLESSTSSVKFWCEPNYGYNGLEIERQIELPVTSYSIAADGMAHPSVYTTVFNATRHEYLNPDVITETQFTTVSTVKLDARAEPTHKASLEPRRKKHNRKGVWMMHPWTHSHLCFLCWTKKESKFSKFKCRSGHYNKYAANCGPEPTPVPPTSTHVSTVIKNIEFFAITPYQFWQSPLPTGLTKKDSPHMPVVLQHPYFPEKTVCADAEWENYGKGKAEVRIQKIKELHKCFGKNTVNINIGIPEKTVQSTLTITHSMTHTVPPPWAQPSPTLTIPLPPPPPPHPSLPMPPLPSLPMPPLPNLSMPPLPNLSMPPLPNLSMPPLPNLSMPPLPNLSIPPRPTLSIPPQ